MIEQRKQAKSTNLVDHSLKLDKRVTKNAEKVETYFNYSAPGIWTEPHYVNFSSNLSEKIPWTVQGKAREQREDPETPQNATNEEWSCSDLCWKIRNFESVKEIA